MIPQMTSPAERQQLFAAASRIVVKIGSSSLTRPDGRVDEARIRSLAAVLAARKAQGAELIVVSSGAIAAGLEPLGLATRPHDLATQQAAASVGQGLLMAKYSTAFGAHSVTVGQVLLAADDVIRRGHYVNAKQTFSRLLQLGVLPIVNENDTVATDEIRFGDNDRLAALVAHLVQADLLLLLTDVDALYDRPPTQPGAHRLAVVADPAELAQISVGASGSKVGTGGMITKVEAAALVTSAGMSALITSADCAQSALAGEDVGTLFLASGVRQASRKLWLAHATRAKGAVQLDSGAVAAVVSRRLSLLPAGVLSVSGEFAAGDPVDLIAPDGTVVARGLINFASAELPALIGRSTREIAAELGSEYARELIHRDDLVPFNGPVELDPQT